MPEILVRKKKLEANVYFGIESITLINKIPEINVHLGRQTITLRNTVPKITVYDNKYVQPPAQYIDAGLYNQEGPIADAGLYNTTSWEIVWDGGTP